MTHRVYKNSSAGPFSFPIYKIFHTHALMINIIYAFGFFLQEILFITTLLLKVNNNTILAFMIQTPVTSFPGPFHSLSNSLSPSPS